MLPVLFWWAIRDSEPLFAPKLYSVFYLTCTNLHIAPFHDAYAGVLSRVSQYKKGQEARCASCSFLVGYQGLEPRTNRL